ncbi:putative PRP39 pre-mRNA processing factor 39 protein [Danaus plexippus plexippus]|uniref:PRP39 pre-mRNA processing factor 39 protein n=1 Tax=Danaus plexippus plexippus TaxID=278856 RepID=A0A212ENJ8_DANPL|nr:pre-mRNA-processing factor 39 [Danaus plexippus plexippus]OWR43072.1 putative PRP39 pre-mRNA processing factor 39 protein [Danaus plexippus plexippus]
MDDEMSSDLQKCLSEGAMDTDEGPLINENSNGLSHLLTDGEFNSVDAAVVDESSTSNQAFLNAVELSTGSVGDYLDNNTGGFNTDSFDVGDNAVNFPSDSLNNVLSDGDSRLSDAFKTTPNDIDLTENQKTVSQLELDMELTQDTSNETRSNQDFNMSSFNERNDTLPSDQDNTNDTLVEQSVKKSRKKRRSSKDEDDNKKNQNSNDRNRLSERKQDSVSDNTQGNSQDSSYGRSKEKVKVGSAEETEVVSEDELPVIQKPSVKDAENVSDDELPGPKPAELPADTEVVSEDELPTSKKDGKESRKRKTEEGDGYDPGSPTSESESANKKQAVSKNGESKPVSAEKRFSGDEKPKKKTLPDLDKYWKVVNDDPTDFTGWTYLLQYVDQESDAEAAREAYDAFLSHYPYCYGYWRKYADYEKRKGSKKKCLEVLERGLKAIPLSVDLWIHYLNHIKTTRTEDHTFIRSQYERAIEACGLEFRSDRLWESYIKWEAENGSALNVTNIYDRLLATPTLGYTSHFDNFQEHVMSEPACGAVSAEELVRLRAEVRDSAPAQPPPDLPPGEDVGRLASEDEAQAIKERIIAARRKVHKTTGEEVAARWAFEEGIKRPYFHVKPLERCQLKNWKAYLEWEKQHGSFKRALVLHERCLIACALYEEFWMRLIKFLEEHSASDPSVIPLQRDALERACTVHHLDKPELHLHWAHFEEANGNTSRAAEILDRIEKTCPNLVQIQYRRINLERRRGEYDKCVQLYEGYISSAKNKAIASALAIKYARFLFHVKREPEAARKVLDDAVLKDPLNARLHMQRLDLALHTPGTKYEELEELLMSYEKQEGAEIETSTALAVRRRELAEELGDAASARQAHTHARTLYKHMRKRARAAKHDTHHHTACADPSKKKENCATTTSTTTASSANQYYQNAAATAQSYDQSYAQPYTPPWGYQQAAGPYPHHPHPHPWPQYPNYY